MKIQKFRRKQEVVEAVQWDGSEEARAVITQWDSQYLIDFYLGYWVVNEEQGKIFCSCSDKEIKNLYDPLSDESPRKEGDEI